MGEAPDGTRWEQAEPRTDPGNVLVSLRTAATKREHFERGRAGFGGVRRSISKKCEEKAHSPSAFAPTHHPEPIVGHGLACGRDPVSRPSKSPREVVIAFVSQQEPLDPRDDGREEAAATTAYDQALWRVARGIAAAFLAGEWDPQEMATRAGEALQERRRAWLRELAEIAIDTFRIPPEHRLEDLAALLRSCEVLEQRSGIDTANGRPLWVPTEVSLPASTDAARWPVPTLNSLGDVAELFGTDTARLRAISDPSTADNSSLRDSPTNYTYRWLPQPTAGSPLLEAPRTIVRQFQRILTHYVLDKIPPHASAHGGRSGTSVYTFVEPHATRRVVVHLHLEGFLPSVGFDKCYGLFRTAGYDDAVARCLTGLVTNAAPAMVLLDCPPAPADRQYLHHRMLRLLAAPHLPQGAPTSVAIADLASFRMDARLTELAAMFGARYSRYVDDLAFSGGRHLDVASSDLATLVANIATDEGFHVGAVEVRVATADQLETLGRLHVN